MTTKGSSPVSAVLINDHLKHISDFSPEHNSKEFKILLESSAVSSRVLPKPEKGEEKFKPRETTSPILKREKSVTPNGYDKAGSVSTNKIMERKTSPSYPPDKKRKAYLMPPMDDPEAERRRRNAVIAWKNRLRRKNETEALERELERLKGSQKEMEGVLQHTREELRQCQEELRRVQTQAAELREDKLALEIQNRTQQEKLAVIREHIILISGSLEEENLAKRFLKMLLERLNTTFPTSFPPESTAGATSSAYAGSSRIIITPPHVTASPPLATSPHLTSSPSLITSCTTSPSLRAMPSLIPVLSSSHEITPIDSSVPDHHKKLEYR